MLPAEAVPRLDNDVDLPAAELAGRTLADAALAEGGLVTAALVPGSLVAVGCTPPDRPNWGPSRPERVPGV